MAETIKKHDFVEVDYTGKLPDGTLFDTTSETVALEHHFHAEKTKYGPIIICVGEHQILPGLDQEIMGKEIGTEYTMTLAPENAFGKRDIKQLKVIPLNTFRQHNLAPQPGLQVDVDGERGTVTSVSGGRVIVNLNHPLAGKEVVYTIKVNRKVTDVQEQLTAFLNATLRIPENKINIELHENKTTVQLPMALPASITDALIKKIVEVTGVKDLTFAVKEQKKEA